MPSGAQVRILSLSFSFCFVFLFPTTNTAIINTAMLNNLKMGDLHARPLDCNEQNPDDPFQSLFHPTNSCILTQHPSINRIKYINSKIPLIKYIPGIPSKMKRSGEAIMLEYTHNYIVPRDIISNRCFSSASPSSTSFLFILFFALSLLSLK